MKRTLITVAVLSALAAGFFPAVSGAEEVMDQAYFLRQVVDLDRLCRVEKGIVSGQASSYDRASRYDEETGEYLDWDANGDSGHYIRVDEETGEALMADLTGPGCIHRIWSANPQGKIRFYLDGDSEPTYEFDFNELFTGNIEPFRQPLVWQRRVVLGGDNPASDSYFPIPFAKSCRVTADKAHGQYYHIGYSLYPKDAPVESFHLPLTEEEQAVLEDVCAKLENKGWDPQWKQITYESDVVELKPGRTMKVTVRGGPGIIRDVGARITSSEKNIHRKLLLRASWDGAREPNIWAPLGDFFGEGFQGGPYTSLPTGWTEAGGYSFWRMPFRDRAEFTVENQGKQPALVALKVGYEPIEEWTDDLAYFEAKWRREIDCSTFDYPFLECEGKGRFVGVALFVQNIHGGWWGEGDEKIYVDGEKFPSYFGTGSEDYFGDAWGIRDFQNAFHGCIDAPHGRQSSYRWHIPDSIPFDESFRMTIENYTANDEVRNDYASMAYWYQFPPEDDFFEPVPVKERIPQPGPPPEGLVEAETIFEGRMPTPGVTVITDGDLDYDLSGGGGLRLRGRPGDLFVLPLPVPRPRLYTLPVPPPSSVKSPPYEILLHGRPVKKQVRLEGDRQEFVIHFTGKKRSWGGEELIIDSFQLEPYRDFIDEWMVIGPWDNPDGQGFSIPYPPEETIDFGAEYEGKDGLTVTWQKAEAGEDGVVDLAALLEPDEHGVAYAYVNVVAPEEMDTTLYLGSDDGVRAWLNGEMVVDHLVQRGIAPDQETAEVKLQPGNNSLLLKIEQGTGAWSFCARFWDPDEKLEYDLANP